MSISRRRLLQIMATAGISLPLAERFLPLYEAYAQQRPSFNDRRGPGEISFTGSVCRDCANHCPLSMRMIDDLPVGLRGTPWHPATGGALCVAGQSQMQALFDPDRLSSPLTRADAGEAATAISWPEAMEALGTKLRALVDSQQGARLAVVDGRTPSLGTRCVEAWVQSIPGATYIPLRVESALDRLFAGVLGARTPGRLHFDLAHSATLLLVGCEMFEVDGSPVSQMRARSERRENQRGGGMPTIYLGPRRSPTAAKADLWIPCRPHQEREVLLGLAESLSRVHPQSDTVMKEYARWVPEAATPVEFARHFSLEYVCERQDLDFAQLQSVVKALKDSGPAVVLGGPGLLRYGAGTASAMAAFALNLWTDGFSQPEILSWRSDPLEEIAREIGLPGARPTPPDALAAVFKPLLETKRSPVDVLICIEANLAHELPGLDQVQRALLHIPYVVSLAHQTDETARFSHLTLPTLLSLESWDIPAAGWGLPEPILQVQRPAVSPVVAGRAVEDIVLELAGAGVQGPDFSAPWDSAQALVAAGMGALARGGQGTLVDAEGRRPLTGVAAATAIKSLSDGSAVWLAESTPVKTAPSASDLQGVAPTPQADLAPEQRWLVVFDNPAVQSGRILNRPMMMELSGLWHGLAWETWLEIHPDDAARAGIRARDQVVIRGPRTELKARAVLTRSVTRGCVAMPAGLGHTDFGSVASGHGANPMGLSGLVFDAASGVPTWGPVPVFIRKS